MAETPVSVIQNAFTSGELSPLLYGRTDLEKYKSGCARLRNFFVNYKGGVTTRPGTQFIGHPGSVGFARLVPFEFSPTQTYVLVFSHLKIRVIKPATAVHPNASGAGFVLSGGTPYEVVTPYETVHLRRLKVMQIADVMWITSAGFTPRKLSRLADDNWTLTELDYSLPMAPALTEITISGLPTGSEDPQETRYMYCVTAVDHDGNESLPSVPLVSGPGINIGSTLGTVTVFWTAAAGAKYYKVYKALPASGDKIPNFAEQFGFAGVSYGTVFTDSNIVADFAKGLLRPNRPFTFGQIKDYNISAPGTGYPIEGTILTVTDGTGGGAVLYPVFDTNEAGDTGGITGIYIANPGLGYTAPTVSATGGSGSGFTATLEIGYELGEIEPDVVGTIHQRVIFAATNEKPTSVFATRTGTTQDFRSHDPPIDSDAFEFSMFQQKVGRILWMRSMPGGLIIGTEASVVQLTGGSSNANNPVAISPTNAVIVPQAYYGAADIPPIIIDSDVLYIQTEGSLVRDLQYNNFTNNYAGSDLTIMSSHLFENRSVTAWAYQEFPNKMIWASMSDGAMLSLTFFKAQDVIAWATHDFPEGLVEDVITVQEFGVNATYVSVVRNSVRCIERFTDRRSKLKVHNWQLDSALYINSMTPVSSVTGLDHLEGLSVSALVDGLVQGPFTVSSGSITLTTPGFLVVVGIPFVCQLQPLYFEPPGESTLQGRRKKPVAATIRVRDALGLQYGLNFSEMSSWTPEYSSTDRQPDLPYTSDTFSGDQRFVLDQEFGLGGWVCVQQGAPYSATILSIIPEMAPGDIE